MQENSTTQADAVNSDVLWSPMVSPAIIHTEREQWLMRRRGMLTASDCAAVLGVSPWAGPWAVYQAKVAGDELVETRAMKRGKAFEAAIAQEYEETTMRAVFNLGAFEIQAHPDIPWLGATLDRITAGSERRPAPEGVKSTNAPLEIKLALGSRSEWDDEPPEHYLVQVQIQMAVTGSDWGALCAMVGPEPLRERDIFAQPEFFAEALPALERFWARVQRHDPPPPDELSGTIGVTKRLYPRESGETIELPVSVLDLVEKWEAAKAAEKDSKEAKDKLGGVLRAMIGTASFGSLADGSLLTLHNVHKEPYQVKEQDYRELRRKLPRIKKGGR